MVEIWLAKRVSTDAAETSPYSSGAMKRVSTSVPTRPRMRAPSDVEMVQAAPRTAVRASDTRLCAARGSCSGDEQRVAGQHHQVLLGVLARGDAGEVERDAAGAGAVGADEHQLVLRG